MNFAGFWRRFGAYTIDVLPITLLTAIVFYWFFGFDETWQAYRDDPRNLEMRIQFLRERHHIRDLSFALWMLYCMIMECSPWQGTVGKHVLGVRVVGPTGERLTFGRSVGRNAAKLLSYLPLAVGFLWAAFSKEKRGWHDMIAKTYVVRDVPD